MERFEELQTLWQQHNPPAPRFDTTALTRDLRRFGRRQDAINLAKLIAVLAVISWQFAQSPRSAFVLCGLALEVVFVCLLLSVDWRNQRSIARLNFTDPSAAFVRSAIERLREQREPFRKFYWPFVLSLVGIINLIFLGLPRTVSALHRVTWHLVGSALPFAGYEIGRWVRARRFDAECLPLLRRLTAMQQALEERSK